MFVWHVELLSDVQPLLYDPNVHIEISFYGHTWWLHGHKAALLIELACLFPFELPIVWDMHNETIVYNVCIHFHNKITEVCFLLSHSFLHIVLQNFVIAAISSYILNMALRSFCKGLLDIYKMWMDVSVANLIDQFSSYQMFYTLSKGRVRTPD